MSLRLDTIWPTRIILCFCILFSDIWTTAYYCILFVCMYLLGMLISSFCQTDYRLLKAGFEPIIVFTGLHKDILFMHVHVTQCQYRIAYIWDLREVINIINTMFYKKIYSLNNVNNRQSIIAYQRSQPSKISQFETKLLLWFRHQLSFIPRNAHPRCDTRVSNYALSTQPLLSRSVCLPACWSEPMSLFFCLGLLVALYWTAYRTARHWNGLILWHLPSNTYLRAWELIAINSPNSPSNRL